MIYGLGTAVAWGFADVGAALVGRRIGSLATTVASQVTAFVLLAAVVLGARPGFGGASAADAAVLVGNGALVAAAYLLFYRALALGPVALVSPIGASYAAVTILLAILLLRESPAGLMLAGAVVTVVGVGLSATDFRALGSGDIGLRDGVPYALASLVLFGVGAFVLGHYSQELGWFPALVLSRTGTAVALLLVALSRRRQLGAPPLAGLLFAAGIGLADLMGLALYTRGAELGLISIVAAVSSTFTLIPVAAGVFFLGERPSPNQGIGVALVVGGLILLGLSH